MKPRFRLPAALLALLAFSASLAEPAWALACAPVPAEAPASAEHAVAPGHEHAAAHRDAPSNRPSDERSGRCPAHDAASVGCGVVPLSVAEAPLSLAAVSAEPDAAPAPDGAPDLLLPSGLFHPPQR